MDKIGGGFIPIIIYSTFGEAFQQSGTIITESGNDILTESGNELIVE